MITLIDKNNNKIILKGSKRRQIVNLISSKFRIEGHDNTISIEENVKIYNGKFVILGNRNCIRIKKNSEFRNFIIRTDGIRCRVIIGENVSYGGGVIHAMNRTKIQIGNECLFSHDIDIRSGDGHPIFLDGMKVRYNENKDITIGKHVWLGIRVQILKGVTIADDCIVGASSVVNKSFEESKCIIAGYPARVIKRNVSWKRY